MLCLSVGLPFPSFSQPEATLSRFYFICEEKNKKKKDVFATNSDSKQGSTAQSWKLCTED